MGPVRSIRVTLGTNHLFRYLTFPAKHERGQTTRSAADASYGYSADATSTGFEDRFGPEGISPSGRARMPHSKCLHLIVCLGIEPGKFTVKRPLYRKRV
jgi:hypothetical protein